MKSALCFLTFLLCLLPWPVLAQTDDVTLLVTLRDDTDQPLADSEIILILLAYGELAVEHRAYAVCRTDTAGQCTFDVNNPPRLADGSAEAYLDVTGIGWRWVSWQGERVEVTLTVADLRLQATVGVPNELGYEYETPGAYNSPPYTVEPITTPTPQPAQTYETAVYKSPSYTIEPAEMPESARQPFGIIPMLCGAGFLILFGVSAWRAVKRQKQGARP